MRSIKRLKSKPYLLTILVGLLFLSSMTLPIVSFFVPVLAPSEDPWWDTNWVFRKPIAIDHGQVDGNLNGFPVLIELVDADLAAKAQGDGDDIAFTDVGGTKLSHELESYDGATGHLVAWVRVPVLSSGTYTTLYMYYGNGAAANQENPEGVWDTDYMMVHHLDGATANAIDDSTNNDNDVTGATGTPIYDVDSKIDGGVEFIPNSGLTVSDADTLDGFTGAATFEAWVRSDDYTAHQGVISKWATGSKAWFIELSYTAPNTKILFYFTEDGSTVRYVYCNYAFTNGNWYHVAVVWRSGQVPVFYVNGVPQTTYRSDATSSIYAGAASLDIGRRVPFYFDGVIDEVRVSDVARSPEWIATQHNNQMDPSTFYDIGIEETS